MAKHVKSFDARFVDLPPRHRQIAVSQKIFTRRRANPKCKFGRHDLTLSVVKLRKVILSAIPMQSAILERISTQSAGRTGACAMAWRAAYRRRAGDGHVVRGATHCRGHRARPDVAQPVAVRVLMAGGLSAAIMITLPVVRSVSRNGASRMGSGSLRPRQSRLTSVGFGGR